MTTAHPDHDALHHRFFSDPAIVVQHHLIDEGAFSPNDLAGRDGLPALLFRLETASDPGRLVALTDALLAWFARHTGFQAARTVFIELPGAAMAPLGPGGHIPEALSEVRNMLATRAEQWRQQWLLGGEPRGEATLLLRLLERRFGALPAWARDRVLAAETAIIEEWGLRPLESASLEETLA